MSPTPGHYHVVYRGYGETQLGWHGETYCLLGGCRVYGDAPLAPTAKVEAQKPVSRRAPKRGCPLSESDEELGAPSPKIRRVHPDGGRLTRKKCVGVATLADLEAEKPGPRRAPKWPRVLAESDQELGCCSPKIQKVQQNGDPADASCLRDSMWGWGRVSCLTHLMPLRALTPAAQPWRRGPLLF